MVGECETFVDQEDITEAGKQARLKIDGFFKGFAEQKYGQQSVTQAVTAWMKNQKQAKQR